MKPTWGYQGGELNPNHYSFPRVSNFRNPGWIVPPPERADKWVFVLALVALFVLVML